jgi:hypothetical protein
MMYRKTMVFCAALLPASCGDGGGSADSRENPPPPGNHVWKSHTVMLDKARAIEDTVMGQSVKQRQTIDELARQEPVRVIYASRGEWESEDGFAIE